MRKDDATTGMCRIQAAAQEYPSVNAYAIGCLAGKFVPTCSLSNRGIRKLRMAALGVHVDSFTQAVDSSGNPYLGVGVRRNIFIV
jgi:hypothetical protein